MLKKRKEQSTHMKPRIMLSALILGARQFTAPLSLLSAPECSCVTTVPPKISLFGCEHWPQAVPEMIVRHYEDAASWEESHSLVLCPWGVAFPGAWAPQQHSLSREWPRAVWQQEGSMPSHSTGAASMQLPVGEDGTQWGSPARVFVPPVTGQILAEVPRWAFGSFQL